ncbi:MAG: hypothetical protein ACNA8P_10385, partial [Phycisphaerales bacterium]
GADHGQGPGAVPVEPEGVIRLGIIEQHGVPPLPPRGVAELADAYGDDEGSLNAWRILLSGYPASSPEWYEARTAHLVVLARIDRPRAAAVLRQHLVLHPEVGPEPYRSRLLELAKELDVAVPESQGGSR